MFSFATRFSPEAANFEKAVFAGFENAELTLTPTRLMSWRTLSKIARSYDLNYVLHFPSHGKLAEHTCEEMVALSRDVGSKFITVHESDLEYAREIPQLDESIELAVENHQVIFEELDDWILSQPAVTLNISHLWQTTLQDCDATELLSVVTRLLHHYRERILSIHFSGYTPEQPVRRPLWRSADLARALMDIFHEEKYDGLVVGDIETSLQKSTDLKADFGLFQDWQAGKGTACLMEPENRLGSVDSVSETI